MALYVDYHSFFFTSTPEAFTWLGAALRFAPTPQAKGKIERAHDFWQKRLPALFAAEHVSTLPEANLEIDRLRLYQNIKEKHREIRSTPQAAWDLARKENRSVLRPAPPCPRWPCTWSVRSHTRVGPGARIVIAAQRLRIELPPRTPVTRCVHPTGHHSALLAPPAKGKRAVLLIHCPAPAWYPALLARFCPALLATRHSFPPRLPAGLIIGLLPFGHASAPPDFTHHRPRIFR